MPNKISASYISIISFQTDKSQHVKKTASKQHRKRVREESSHVSETGSDIDNPDAMQQQPNSNQQRHTQQNENEVKSEIVTVNLSYIICNINATYINVLKCLKQKHIILINIFRYH